MNIAERLQRLLPASKSTSKTAGSAKRRRARGRERRKFQSGSQPLGIYFHDNDAVSLVWSQIHAGELTVVESAYVQFNESDAARRDQACTKILLDLVRERHITERRCIIGIHPDKVQCEPLEITKGFTQKEMYGAALLKTESMVRYPAEERAISVDTLPQNARYRMLSVAQKSDVERLQQIVTDAALIPHAIDAPLAAWSRLLPDADAILDLSHERAILTVFRNPHPTGFVTVLAARLSTERIITDIQQYLRDARDRGTKDVARLVVYGQGDTAKLIRERLARLDDALTITPLAVGDLESPEWAYALALSTWEYDPPTERAA